MLSLHLFSENLESNLLLHIWIYLRFVTLYYQTNHCFVLIKSLSLQKLVSFFLKKQVVVCLLWYKYTTWNSGLSKKGRSKPNSKNTAARLLLQLFILSQQSKTLWKKGNMEPYLTV